MTKVTIEEAQANLTELIEKLSPGQEIVITRDNHPIAHIRTIATDRPRPLAGRCKGMLTIVSDDGEHLEHWSEYIP